ncbi:hypothetical protein FDP41_006874 [Naegleria fowleri]|uniref:Uncharacterized protein n=1 Tax=Naegleria fowleri TaxID=5763 RepID=A0A6A5BJR3_NAEFO|nr:uncharacterized protein FDP41_006874 [Naegleria fowleri]KAF0974264.1 hypothetical protein FDP41_006874 [Naegleria fowleri]CAG4709141.1 unnamed protein product [Naegleria fowleri]
MIPTTATPLFDSLPKEDFNQTTREYLRSITQQVTGALINVPLCCSAFSKKETTPLVGDDDQEEELNPTFIQKEQEHMESHKMDECIVFYQAYNSTIANYAVQNQRFEGCSAFDMKRMTWIKPNYLWMMYRSEFAKAWNQTNILALYIQREYFEKVILENAVCSMCYPELEKYYGSKENWKKSCLKQKQKVGKFVNDIKRKEKLSQSSKHVLDIQELVEEQRKLEKEYSSLIDQEEEPSQNLQNKDPIVRNIQKSAKTSDNSEISNENKQENVEEASSESFVGFARVQWDPYHTPSFGKVHGGLTRAIQIGLKGSFISDMVKCGALRRIEDITEYVKQQHEKYQKSGDITIPVERFIEIHNEMTCKKLGIVERILSQPMTSKSNLDDSK